MPVRSVSVHICCAREDNSARNEFVRHLAPLQQAGIVSITHDPSPGGAVLHASELVTSADLVAVLLSSDFFATSALPGAPTASLLSRIRAGRLTVPVILRPCDWKLAPFASLQALPLDELPITSWPSRDEAWCHVAMSLRALLENRRIVHDLPPRDRTVGFPPVVEIDWFPRAGLSRGTLIGPYTLVHQIAEGHACQIWKAAALHGHEIDTIQVPADPSRNGRADPREWCGYTLLEKLSTTPDARELWTAAKLGSGRAVVLKIPHANIDQSELRRLNREARVLTAIDSPFVCRVIETLRNREFECMVLEYLEGETFEQRYARCGPWSLPHLAPLITDVLAGLSAAHTIGVVHRAITARDILITPLGARTAPSEPTAYNLSGSIGQLRVNWTTERAKLIDFGATRILRISHMARTVTDLSSLELKASATRKPQNPGLSRLPESIALGSKVDERADVFSLGCLIAAALNPKRNPLGLSASASEFGDSLVNGRPLIVVRCPGLAKGADSRSFFSRALSLDPETRFRSATEMKVAWEALCASSS